MRKPIAAFGGLIGLILIAAWSGPPALAGDEINRLRVDNRSGYPAVIRIYQVGTDLAMADIVAQAGVGGWIKLPSGSFYTICRYGPLPPGVSKETYHYHKGQPFRLNPPPGQMVEATVILYFKSMSVRIGTN